MKKYRLIIFDLDGTLADTSEGILECHKYANSVMGRPVPSDEELSGIIGDPLLKTYKERFRFADNDAKKAVEIYRNKYAETGIYGAKVYKHIPQTLAELKNMGMRLAVATLKAEPLAKKILNNLNIAKYFDVIHGVDLSDTLNKPDLIDLCINDINVSKDESALVGDSVHDAIGAKKSGIDFIAVRYGFGFLPTDKLDDINATFVIDDPNELTNIL